MIWYHPIIWYPRVPNRLVIWYPRVSNHQAVYNVHGEMVYPLVKWYPYIQSDNIVNRHAIDNMVTLTAAFCMYFIPYSLK